VLVAPKTVNGALDAVIGLARALPRCAANLIRETQTLL
jgi:hypothetical protein